MITHRQSGFGHRRQQTTLVGVQATWIPKIVYDGANGYRTEEGVVYTISQSLIKISSDPHLAKSREKSAVRWQRDIPTRQTFDEYERIYHQMVREQGTQKIPARVRAYF